MLIMLPTFLNLKSETTPSRLYSPQLKVRLSTVPQPFKEQTIDKNHIFKAPLCNIELRANG